jgi:hypothetical protein
MRAVWSFWSKPFLAHHASAWPSQKHHLLSWVLSLQTARRHYSDTWLWTDDEGARILVDGIGLEFEHVSTDLNRLADCDDGWWMLGKLHTYRSQEAAFVHIDSDVYLWKPLARKVAAAQVFAQSPEEFPFGGRTWYRPHLYDSALRSADGWMPEEWSWYVARRGKGAVCCGILGANRIDFLRYYAQRAIDFVLHPANQAVWSQFDRIQDNILFEQYFLSACIEYCRHHSDSEYRDIDMRYIFESPWAPYQQAATRAAGYTHLIAGAKGNPVLAERLERRVERDFPEHYERVLRYLRGNRMVA